jgi:hypothetical protein
MNVSIAVELTASSWRVIWLVLKIFRKLKLAISFGWQTPYELINSSTTSFPAKSHGVVFSLVILGANCNHDFDEN